MTQIHFAPVGNGTTTPRGYIEGRPVGSGALPDSFRAVLVDGEVSVEVEPTTLTWVWNFVERVDYGRNEYAQVDDLPGTVEYDALTKVNGDDFSPSVPPSPAWLSALAAAEAEIESAQTVAEAAQADASSALSGLGTKVNTSTYVAGLATKTDLSSTGREALSLTDYQKLMPARVAIANRMNARADIVILGASVAEGAFVSTYSRTVAQSLAAILRAENPTPGVTGGRGFIGIPSKELTTSPHYTPGMWPIAFQNGAFDPATAGAASTFDLGAKHMLWYTNNGGAGGNKATLTLAAPVTSFNIHHVKGTSGGATTGYYKADAAASVPFATNAAVAAATATPGPAATTSVEVGWNATGFLLLTGIREFNGDENAGIQVHNCGHSGMTIPEWQDGYAAAGSWLDDVALLTPKLLILQDLMINDAFDGLSAAACQANVTAFIAALRTKIPAATCPIILAASYDPSGGGALPSAWSTYVAAHKAVADADPSVVFVDHSARIPSSALPDTYGLYNTVDHVHPRAAGTLNVWMAKTYAAMLADR